MFTAVSRSLLRQNKQTSLCNNLLSTAKFSSSNGFKRELPLKDDKPLQDVDPELAGLLLKEQKRQFNGIELIASENYTSRYVL